MRERNLDFNAIPRVPFTRLHSLPTHGPATPLSYGLYDANASADFGGAARSCWLRSRS